MLRTATNSEKRVTITQVGRDVQNRKIRAKKTSLDYLAHVPKVYLVVSILSSHPFSAGRSLLNSQDPYSIKI